MRTYGFEIFFSEEELQSRLNQGGIPGKLVNVYPRNRQDVTNVLVAWFEYEEETYEDKSEGCPGCKGHDVVAL